MRRPLVAGNWKMNGTRDSVSALLSELKSGCELVETAELVVFPPFVYLDLCERTLVRTQISWGAQDVSSENSGAYTGEISAEMLNEFQCRYVIVGHSERRTLHHETNSIIALKFRTALSAGINPVLCVGETLEQRESGETFNVIQEQLAAVLDMYDNSPAFTEVVIAYEPVWAIGTGKNATAEQVQSVHEHIRHQLRKKNAKWAEEIRILYGGSVNPGNAAVLLELPDVDGALVGGASLKAEQFLEIGRLCNT